MDKLVEELEAGLLAFFGMELGGHHVATTDGSAEGSAVIGFHPDETGVLGDDVIAVNEVEVWVRFVGRVEGAIGLSDRDLIPAHVGHFERGREIEANGAAGEDAEPWVFAKFFAGIEEELHSEADAEEGSLGGDGLTDGIDETAGFEFAHGIGEGSNAREDETFGVEDFVGGLGDVGVPADLSDGIGNGAEVPHLVVDNGHARRRSKGGSHEGREYGLRGWPSGGWVPRWKLAEILFEEGEAIAGELEFILEHASPDFGGGGEFGESEAEGFDGAPTVVADVLDGLEDFGPFDITSAWGGAIIFADMDVVEDIADFDEGGG